MQSLLSKILLGLSLSLVLSPAAMAQSPEKAALAKEGIHPATSAPQVPMSQVGPGDMLTTPEGRARMEREQRQRLHDPAAMDRQLDRTESKIGLDGRR